MGKIKDIYEGDLVQVWKDEDCVTISILNATVSVSEEQWEDIRKELKRV